jgi:maltose alpha-D-glucosyltransferase / alpha-amylase
MTEQFWFKNAVVYSLDLETFRDANGDGVGDFEGLSRRLEYLHALGVDTIWLAPFQPTPNRDNGYDISDFYGVDPRHGSSGDFVNFIHKAKGLGLRIIIDLVVNHTSDEHPWFKEARSSTDNAKRHWYIWSAERPSDWNEGMVFPGVQEATWTRDEVSGEYYFHRFYEHMPDLNTDNLQVREEIWKIMGFWLQMGVSGFRMDAVPFVLESPAPGEAEPVTHFEYLKEMRRFLQWRKGDAIMLGEANVLPKDTRNYFGENGDGIHMMFNFYANQYTFYALASGDTRPLKKALEETRAIPATCQWAYFLRNHDELDLGRLTDEERKIVFDRFGPEKKMQVYDRGIRRRLAPMLGSRELVELACSFLFALPGTPVIRYGDEIGMGDNLDLQEREAVRTPMQWSAEFQSEFSSAPDTVHPLIDSGEYDYHKVNVEYQRRDPASLLNWTTHIIRLRKECPEIGLGEWDLPETGDSAVICLRYRYKENALFTWHNFSGKAVTVSLPSGEAGADTLTDLINNDVQSTADDQGMHRIQLHPFGYRWFRKGGIGQ